MGCGASSSVGDVSDPQPLPARGNKFGGWENETGWGELGSGADPQTPEMDALWKVVPAALSNLQLKAFQRVLLLNASDMHSGLKGFMKVCRKGAGTVHTTRLAMAADLPSKGNSKDVSPIVKRFVYAMSGCEGWGREMPFRSYLVCLKIMHKFKATQTDKLKFWFNVMKCSDKNSDGEAMGEAMADRVDASADYDMVCGFIVDAVLSDVNAAHAKSRSRVISSVKTAVSSAGFQSEDIVTFAHFCRLCTNVSPSYGATLSTTYDRLRSAFAPIRGGKVSSLGSLKIKAYFYERAQQMVDLERELSNASISDSSGWKHSFAGDKRPNASAVSSFVDSDDDSMLSVVDSSIVSRATSSTRVSFKQAKEQPPSLSNARRSSRVPFSSISSSEANAIASGQGSSEADSSIMSGISKGMRIDDSALDISVSSQASFASSNHSTASSSSSTAQLKSALRDARAGRHAAARPAAEDVLQEVEEEEEEDDWGATSQGGGKGGFLLQAFKSSLEYLENVKNEEAARAAAMRKERDERIRGVIERESTSQAGPVGIYVSGREQQQQQHVGTRASRPKRAPGALRRARIAGGASDEEGSVGGGNAREVRMLSSSREFHGFDSPKVGRGGGGGGGGGGFAAGDGRRRMSGTPFGIRPLEGDGSPFKSPSRSAIGTPYSSEKAALGASGAGHSFFGGGPTRGLAVDDLMATPSRGERERRVYDDSVSAMAKLTFGSVPVDSVCASEARGEVAGFSSRAPSDKPWLAAALSRQSIVGAF